MSSKNTSGGWAMHRPKRCSQERQNFVQKKERAFDRAYKKLGKNRFDAVQILWRNQETVGGDKRVSDGTILCLQSLNLSNIEIMSFLPVIVTDLTVFAS